MLSTPAMFVVACGDDVTHYHEYNNYYGDGGADAEAGSAGKAPVGGRDSDGGGAGGGAGAGGDSTLADYPDAPRPNTKVADHELDLFGVWGNRFWFAVSDEQLAAMNNETPGGFPGQDGLYRPGGGGRANWVDHLLITTAGDAPQTADYGKLQARIVGQYSRFPWDAKNIPNLNIDADQFIEGQRIAGYEHLRFSNGQRGSIFRDKLAYDLYRKLDYPAPLATYVWVQSNVWGPQVSIPYTLVERYKRSFCERYSEQFGGGCLNMWEFVGDFGGGGGGGPFPIDIKPGEQAGESIFDAPDNCQIDKCDTARVRELEAKLQQTPQGPGFKEALASYIDWPSFHRFQCLSWVLATSDDTIHAGNNVVLVEREDGLFQYLPYSIDISMGFNGGGWNPGLPGQSTLARGCQADESCWSDTLDMCEDVIHELTAIDPRAYLKSLYDELDAQGMLRAGDEANYQGIDSYFEQRLENLPTELQQYREGKSCEPPYVDCNGQCLPQWECVDPCGPGKPMDGLGGAAGVGDGGAAGDPGGDVCPGPMLKYAPSAG